MTVEREMDQQHRDRVCQLLNECPGTNAGFNSAENFLAAYNAVLAKDLLFVTSELLAYKRNEVHQ